MISWSLRAPLAAAFLVLLGPSVALAETSFAGIWDSTYGTISLTQDGAKVTGHYSSQMLVGTLKGAVTGRRLTLRYKEIDGTTGQAFFELDKSGDSFAGSWRADGETEWAPWNGTRQAREKAEVQPLGFNGLFDTNYGRLRLSKRGASVRGRYSGGKGRLRGAIRNGVLRFQFKEKGGLKGRGWFALSGAGSVISGQWSASGAPPSNEKNWTGTRATVEPGVRWLVVLEAAWEESFAEKDYSFGEILRTYFQRMPLVRVRHRRVTEHEDVKKALMEASLLAEPVAVVIAGHGDKDGVLLGKGTLTAKHITDSLGAFGHNIELLHFSSCDIFAGAVPKKIARTLGKNTPAISGYAIPVDWSASAIFEMLYLELVVGRHLSPKQAASIAQKELRFAGDKETKNSPLGALHFRFRPKPKTR